MAYLDGREPSVIEHISSLSNTISTPSHPGTNLRVPNTRTDLSPVALIRYALLQPTRVVLQVIVQIGPVREGAAGALVGDGVGEYDEAEEGGDDEEHDELVEPHEEGVAVAGAGEARQRHDHDGGADHDERPLQELQAVGVVGTAAQPYPAAQDGDRQQEREEVHYSYQVVA